MRLSLLVAIGAVGVAAYLLLREKSSEPAPASAAPMPRPPRREPPRGNSNAGATKPKPSEQDPRFVRALEEYERTKRPGYIGIQYGRPFWRWDAKRQDWVVSRAV